MGIPERVFRAQLLAPLCSYLVRQQPEFSTTQVPIPKVSRVGWDFQVIFLKHPEFGVQRHTEPVLPCINARLAQDPDPHRTSGGSRAHLFPKLSLGKSL